MKKPTMRDIGKAVGVSAVTVSKALAGKPGMSDAVRQRIERAAAEMGYVYPGMDRAASPHLDIGILIPEAFFEANSFYASLYKRLVQRLTEAGHFTLLELVERTEEEQRRLPKMLESRKVNGLILLGQPRKEYDRFIAAQGIPVVFLDFYDEQANYRATSSIMDRYLGYYRALLGHGLPLREDWILMDRDAENHLLEIALPEEMPTAFVCNCDVVARRLIRALTARGLRVPEDISVTGFDDFETEVSAGPGISTFRVDQDAMAETAVRTLLNQSAGGRRSHGRTVISGQPVYRESEKPLENSKGENA